MNKITKLILRLLKDNKIYISYIDNEFFNLQFNNITIPWTSNKREIIKYQELYNLLDVNINIKLYKDFSKLNYNVVIINIKNIEKLFNYFNKNGIVWGGGKKCTMDNMPEGFKPNEKTFLKLYNDDNRIYYGKNYSPNKSLDYDSLDIVMTEDEFYIFYEKYKKKINDNFESFLKEKI